MIYSKGTLTTVAGSATVTGSGSTWNRKAAVGDTLYVGASSKAYFVGAVISDTELRLTTPFSEGPQTGATYKLVRDFSAHRSIPYPHHRDVEKATVVSRAVQLMDGLLDSLHDRIFDLEYPSGAVLDINVAPTIDLVYIPGANLSILPAGLGSLEVFGNLTVVESSGGLYIHPQGIASQQVVGGAAFTVSPPLDQVVLPAGILSAQVFGLPSVSSQQGIVTADSFDVKASSDAVSADGSYIAPIYTLFPAGIASQQLMGAVSVYADPVTADSIETADSGSITADGAIGPPVSIITVDNNVILTTDDTVTTNTTNI